LPVVLLRSDISAVGAVAHQAFAGFVGWSAHSRHGPLPMRRPEGDDERDESASVLVPSLNDYVKTSKLSVFARIRRLDVLRCDDRVCRGDSLLRIADLGETDLPVGRMLACVHNLASTEQLARRVLAAADPRDAWWEASIAASGIRLGVAAIQRRVKPANKLASWTARSSLPVAASTMTSAIVSGDSRRRMILAPSSWSSATPLG